MRVLGRLAATLLLGLLLLSGIRLVDARLGESEYGFTGPGLRNVTTYLLPGDGWIEFSVADPGKLRILSNAASAAEGDAELRYAIDYEIVDARGERFRTGRYHHRSRPTLLSDPREIPPRPPFPRARFAHSGDGATRSAELRLGLEGAALPAVVRLARADASPAVREVTLRVSQHETLPLRKSRSAWERLSRREREHRAGGFALPVAWLKPFEVAALARESWRPLGPKGIEGADYHERVLVIESDPVLVRARPESHARTADRFDIWSMLPASLALARDGDPLALKIRPLDPDIAPATVSLRFVPADRHAAIETSERVVPAEGIRFEWPAPDGWLELSASTHLVGMIDRQNDDPTESGVGLSSDARDPGAQRAQSCGDASSIDLPTGLSTYDLHPEQTLEFAIHHVGLRPTPLRLDVRSLFDSEPDGRPRLFEYALVDEGGRTLAQDTLEGPTTVSRFDYSRRTPPDAARLSEARSVFFSVPPEVRRLRIIGDPRLSAVAYSRPPDRAHPVRAPQDYRPVSPDCGRIPSWFRIEPIDRESPALADRTHRIILQPRPREIDPEIAAGRYEWRSFKPKGDWQGSQLLEPREDDRLPRKRSLGASFFELGEGTQWILDFEATDRGRNSRPRLVYLRDERRSAELSGGEQGAVDAPPSLDEVEVRIDGEVVLSDRLIGSRGSLDLPPVAVGTHRLEIRGEARTRWLVSHVRNPGPRLDRRLGIRLGTGRSLEFEVDKQDAEELLVLRFHADSGSSRATRLHVEVSGPTPPVARALTGWTLRSRRFDVTPPAEAETIPLDSTTRPVASGRRLLVPLASDLPEGPIRLRITHESGPSGYVALSRTRTQRALSRRALLEDDT